MIGNDVSENKVNLINQGKPTIIEAEIDELVKEAVGQIGLQCVGWMPKDKQLHMPDRHLGLVPVEERPDVEAQIARAASEIVIDMDALTSIARTAKPIDIPPMAFPPRFACRRIGLAKVSILSVPLN